MQIHAKAGLLPEGWAQGLRVTVEDGLIVAVQTGAAPQPGDTSADLLLPGLSNLHSHAFQRGFSGLTERRGPGRDSFWTWRETMYRFALALDPEGAEALAALAYAEMLEAGYTRVGEFHYLHHAQDGRPYGDPAEMSARILAAAEATGIALTHLPVFYAHGGFGAAAPGEGQRRFLHGIDGFMALMQRCEAMLTRPQDRLGLAPHSLRAAGMDQIRLLAEAFPGRPFHIHVAEQRREVADCLAATGARPVQLLLDGAPVGKDWCLIHATHLDDAETAGMAASGAVAGLCPLTEANLGDGIFRAEEYLAAGGTFGVGTDSNVCISAAGELQMLEYSQRLGRTERNLCADPGFAQGSTGARLFAAALAGGAQALGAAPAAIRPGAPADLVAIRDDLELDLADGRQLDRWIFGRDLRVEDVWACGRHLVRQGRHIHRDAIARAAGRVIQRTMG